MNITIDGQTYDLNTLSEEAKAQIASIQAVDIKLNELRRDTAIAMTARNSYAQALKKSLEAVSSSAAPNSEMKSDSVTTTNKKRESSKAS